MIHVDRLTKRYGPTLAVDGVSFNVAKGDIVGFLGPNGAGKSTTLRMLTCFLPPTSGTASVNGFDIFHQSQQVRENLGYLPENVPMYPEMKVREYLEFRGKLRGMNRSERRERMEYVVERCWLGNVTNKVIGHLSKGFRQRVGLADSLLHDPPVLILDEPTVGLDPTQIRETRKLIKELGGKHTVLLSTHILPEVEAVCDKVVIIAGGRVVAKGTPDELRSSRRMQARVIVECRGPEKEVASALMRVSGVKEVEPVHYGDGETNYTRLALWTRDGYDVREEVARTIQSNSWTLRELGVEHATLEEYFVEVTANQAAARNTDGAADADTTDEAETAKESA